MKRLMIAAILASTLSYGANVDATNPSVILNLAKGFGSAELTKDREGDPKISARMDGSKYTIYFYGCTNGRACTSIQFSAGWSDTGATESQMTDWNRNKRFAKAYLDSDNDPILEMDVNLEGGVSQANLEDTFDWFKTSMKSFKRETLRMGDSD